MIFHRTAVRRGRPGNTTTSVTFSMSYAGTFRCLPFGDSPEGPAHGETACESWTIVSVTTSSAHLRIDASDTGARVNKVVSVRDGQSALFQEFTISELNGAYSYGTHPILDLSPLPVGTARIRTGTLATSTSQATPHSHHPKTSSCLPKKATTIN